MRQKYRKKKMMTTMRRWSILIFWYLFLSNSTANETFSGEVISTYSTPRLSSCPLQCRCPEALHVNCSSANLKAVPRDIDPNTTVLILDNNPLLSYDFNQLPMLNWLSVANCSLVNVADNIFRVQAGTLVTLNLTGNDKISSTCSFLFGLNELKHLDLSGTNRLNFHQIFKQLPKLEVLNLSRNSLAKFPGRNSIPNLQVLDLSENGIKLLWKYKKTKPTNVLKRLILSKNKIKKLPTNFLLQFPELKYFDISENIIEKVASSALNSKTLKKLKLRHNKLRLTEDNWDIFQELPNLRALYMSKCRIYCGNATQALFRNLRNLRTLDVSATRIRPTKETFASLNNLTILKLNANSMSTLRSEVFEAVADSLKTLELSHCGLSKIEMNSLPVKLWKQLRKVDFSSNPFLCDCGFVWLGRWVRRAKASNVTLLGLSSYSCHGPHGSVSLTKMTLEMEMECFRDPLTNDPSFIFFFLFSFLLSISSSTVSMLYRFRWNIRHWYFFHVIKRNESLNKRSTEHEDKHFTYDAFICYSSHDALWVRGQLLQRLEHGQGGQLCLHERDWTPGKDIAENIIDSIDRSRKTVVIASNAFALSPWCHFELAMVQTKLLEDDKDRLIVVLLEEIADCNLSPRLHLELHRCNYIEWTPANACGQQLFWERLKQSLVKPTTSAMNASVSLRIFT